MSVLSRVVLVVVFVVVVVTFVVVCMRLLIIHISQVAHRQYTSVCVHVLYEKPLLTTL